MEQGGWEGFSPPWGFMSGGPKLRVAPFCLMLKLVAKGWAKSASHSSKKWALLSQRSSFLVCLLIFMPATLLFSPPSSLASSVRSPFHPSPSSPSRFSAVRNRQTRADLSPQMLPFLPSHPFPPLTCEHHPKWGQGRLPSHDETPQSMAFPSHPPLLLPPSSTWSCLGQQERRNDLSHPIHADNCLLDPEANECWKEPPAYTFRDYR